MPLDPAGEDVREEIAEGGRRVVANGAGEIESGKAERARLLCLSD